MASLDWGKITDQLNEGQLLQLKQYRLEREIGSTNEVALEEFCRSGGLPAVCFAEMQTTGRGRLGRVWVSPKSENIYMSLAWEFALNINELQALSLAVAVVVADILKSYGVDAGLKWPNDIQVKGKKLAGILLESSIKPSGRINLVIGIGLNIMMPDAEAAAIEQPWTDLARESGEGYGLDRNKIAGKLLSSMMRLCMEYETTGFEPYRERWQGYDVCTGMDVQVTDAGNVYNGACLGINDKGALRVMVDGVEQEFYGAEVSLRVNKNAVN
jgi:BirA family transcriptional regulator, biotin operon repressor / biotin---[acetyl-CoA-carboxylase] ligase